MKPKLRSQYVPVRVGSGRLVFHSEVRTVNFDNDVVVEVLEQLLPLLDGSRSIDEIVNTCAAKKGLSFHVLQLLSERSLLEEKSELLRENKAVERYLQEIEGNDVGKLERLRNCRPWVIGTGRLLWQVVEALADGGIETGFLTDLSKMGGTLENGWSLRDLPSDPQVLTKQLDDASLVVTVMDRLWQAMLEHINQAALNSRKLWIPVLVQGNRGQLGPTVKPYESACFTCFDLRMRGNLADIDVYLALIRNQSIQLVPPEPIRFPAFERVMAAQAALEIHRIVKDNWAGETVGRLIEFHASDFRVLRQNVLKLPRCPSCGVRSAPLRAWDEIESEQVNDDGRAI